MLPRSKGAAEILGAVSRETRRKLEIYEAELRRWQRVKNLVGQSTLDQLWDRHFADALQLVDLADGAVWADLGSGAGFPGLVVAIARPERVVHLVESDSRKCAFLRHVARETGTQARVIDDRIESALQRLEPAPDVVTARALASLTDLLRYTAEPLLRGATALFPKGRGYQTELTRARESMTFEADVLPSRVDGDGVVLRIRAPRFEKPGQPT